MLHFCQPGLPAENLDLPPSEQFFSKKFQFCPFAKFSCFYPFFGHFWPKLRHFYPIFKNTEFWKKSVYRLIFGIPTTLAALPPWRPCRWPHGKPRDPRDIRAEHCEVFGCWKISKREISKGRECRGTRRSDNEREWSRKRDIDPRRCLLTLTKS